MSGIKVRAKRVVRSPRVNNHAVIRMTFPDGCKVKIETRRDSDIASDPQKFIRWLLDTADEWHERMTTAGMCGVSKHRSPRAEGSS